MQPRRRSSVTEVQTPAPPMISADAMLAQFHSRELLAQEMDASSKSSLEEAAQSVNDSETSDGEGGRRRASRLSQTLTRIATGSGSGSGAGGSTGLVSGPVPGEPGSRRGSMLAPQRNPSLSRSRSLSRSMGASSASRKNSIAAAAAAAAAALGPSMPSKSPSHLAIDMASPSQRPPRTKVPPSGVDRLLLAQQQQPPLHLSAPSSPAPVRLMPAIGLQHDASGLGSKSGSIVFGSAGPAIQRSAIFDAAEGSPTADARTSWARRGSSGEQNASAAAAMGALGGVRAPSRRSSIASSLFSTLSAADEIWTFEVKLRDCLMGVTGAPVSKEDYRQYLQVVERGSENLDFYLSVEQIKKIWLEYKKFKIAHQQHQYTAISHQISELSGHIVGKYVSQESPHQINVDENTRESIMQHFRVDGLLELAHLLPAQRHVYHLMENDSFKRFLKYTATNNTGEDRRRSFKIQALVGGVLYVLSATLFLTVGKSSEPQLRWLCMAPACVLFSGVVQWHLDFCLVYGISGKTIRRTFHRLTNIRTQQQVQLPPKTQNDSTNSASESPGMAPRSGSGSSNNNNVNNTKAGDSEVMRLDDRCLRRFHRKRAILIIICIALLACLITLPIYMAT